MPGFLSGLGGLFESKAITSSRSEGTATRHAVTGSGGSSMAGNFTSAGRWDTEKALKDGYEKSIWVFRCVDAIATNQSAIPIYVRKGDERSGTIAQFPQLVKLLNIRPNNYETAAMFRYRLSSILLLSRKGAFIEIVGSPQNPESLHLIPPTHIEPIKHPTRFVSGYRIKDENNVWSDEPLKPEQVIWIRTKPHPTDPYAQMTPLVPAGVTAETDFFARMFNRNFLMNDGRPGLLVSIKGQMNNEDASEIKRRFAGGPATAGQTTVIEADGIDVADMGATPRDAQWQEITRSSKEDILLAFGVPESVMGNASGRTFDNADAEYESFWIHTMKPHCEFISGGLDIFTGNLSDETVVSYDYKSVDVLQRQERLRHQTAIEQWTAGAITWNEMRTEIGRDPWKDALGARIIVLPSGFAMAEKGTDQALIMKLPNINQGEVPADPREEARKGALEGVAVGQRHLGNELAARALRSVKELEATIEQKQLVEPEPDIIDAVVVHPYLQTRTELEASLLGVMTGFDMRQEDICTERLNHAKVRKDTRHWEGETKAFKKLDPYYVVEVDRWAGEMRNTFDRVLRPVMQKEAERIARDMDRQGVLSRLVSDGTANGSGKVALDRLIGSQADQKALIDNAMEEILNVVETSTRNQSNRIAKKIQELDEEGKSLDEIKKEIQSLVSTRSTWRKSLAGHVTTSSVESMKSAVYGMGGKYITKQWNCEEDERVRPSHRDADGETKSASQPFEVGSTMMMFPGDPVAPVEEVAGCRCWLDYSTTNKG